MDLAPPPPVLEAGTRYSRTGLAAAVLAVLALIALGYKQIDAHKAVRDLQEKGEAKSAEELVKLVLKKMATGR